MLIFNEQVINGTENLAWLKITFNTLNCTVGYTYWWRQYVTETCKD